MRHLGLSGSRLLAQAPHLQPWLFPHSGHDRLGTHLMPSPALLRGQLQRHRLPLGGVRSFSVQPLVETSVTTAQYLFSELHAFTGTPWYITIPLIALSINLVGRLPISLHTRMVAQRRATLSPLLRAWYARHAKDVAKMPLEPQELKKKTDERFKATAKRVYREWGVQRWKDFTFLGILPLWLTGIEAMRRLSGTSKGLLGTLFSSPAAEEAGAAEVVTDTLPPSVDASLSALQSASPGESVIPSLPAGADPTLVTEGCLWFPDLTVPDPLHILPFVLSAILIWRLLPSDRFGFEVLLGTRAPPTSTPTQRFGRPLHRALLLLSLFIGPATMSLPAAVHLYWVSSAVITNLQSDIINRLIKLPKVKGHVPRGRESTLVRPPAPPESRGTE
ncbi:hypothetical protein GQ53DRAFT_326346 [Thozetella sp. PMI_491]|nr:hypothetical protein GQ53DRAFT_326346 [Thozetella sp. PMI_491]